MKCAFLLLCFGASLVFAQGSPDVVISQVYGGGGNTGAPLRNDFIELFNRGRTPVSLSGWSVQYASATAESWQVTPLTGSIAPGRYFLVQQAEGANTSLPSLPAADVMGTIAMSGTAAKVALSRAATALTGSRPADAVDLVGYGGASGFEGTSAARALTNSTAAARRASGCTDTDDNASDFQIVEPQPRNSQAAAVDCSVAAEPPVSLRISDIQGTGAASPYAGRNVITRGVITGLAGDGFWIQSVPGEEDNDSATSEGLWVYFGMSPPGTTERGYVVQVTGTVQEFRPAADPGSEPLTEIVDPRYEIVSRGQALPAPVTLESGVNWEWFENMLVEASAVHAVSPTVSDVFFATLPGLPRPYRGPSATDEPERLRVDMRSQGGPVIHVTSPSIVSGVRGVLDYAFRTWTVAQSPLSPIAASGRGGAQPIPAVSSSEFHVASMNLQRFASNTTTKLTKASTAIREYLRSPDIVAVQEVDNLDALRALARAAGDYDAHLLEGNDIGGIDVGLLTRRDRLRVDSVVQEGRDASYLGGALWERPPLVAKVAVSGVPITVVVVHPRSLINAEDSTVAARRRAQAEFLRDLATARTRAGEAVMMLGDFNTFPFDENMGIIRSAGLTNLTDTVSPNEGYSYIQNGATQTLDHILISESLRPRLVRTMFLHLNADYPESLGASADLAERLSDHDIPVAYLSLEPTSLQIVPAGITNAATFLSGPVAPLELITIFGRGFSASSRVFFDNVPVQPFYADANQISVTVPASTEFRGATIIEVETGGTKSPAINLPVVPAMPGVFVSRSMFRIQAAVLNQDNGVNGRENPAGRGSVIQIFATGQGASRPGGPGMGRIEQPTAVRIGGRLARVLYSGQAPGLIEGAWQINAVVPEDVSPGDAELIVSAGGRISAFGVRVAVR